VFSENGHSGRKATFLEDKIEMFEIDMRMKLKSNCASASLSIYDITKWSVLWYISKFLERDYWPIHCADTNKKKNRML
jgi:hypothetical protein